LEEFKTIKPYLMKKILATEAHTRFGSPCACGNAVCEVTCNDCTQYQPTCKACFVSQHRTRPFHWAEVWDAGRGCLVRHDIARLDHVIALGHYGAACEVSSGGGTPFTIVSSNGIHATRVDFCRHGVALDKVGLLLDAQLFPCSFKDPKSAITFECLKMFEMLSMEGKIASFDFVGAWSRITDNSFTETVPDMQENFIRCAHLWGVLTLMKRMGQEHGIDKHFPHRPAGNLVLYCPSCPEPGFNMDSKLGVLPAELRHLNQQRDTLDGNFHCNKAKKNYESADISLCGGKAYFPTNDVLASHLAQQSAEPEPEYPCVYLKAVKNQDKKKFKNMEITGIVNTQCSHVFVKASVDLQYGER
ncbi:hypothetical protein R3P38DRAFT_2496266, partial [Favolaschia claudopus]